jgi:hypothetical protein
MLDKADLPESYWWEYLQDTYVVTQAAAVRRQVDSSSEAASLGRLLTELSEDPTKITLELWWSFWGGEDEHDRWVCEKQWGENYGGETGDYLDPALPSADLEALKLQGEKVWLYATRYIAHSDARGIPKDEMATFADLDETLDLIGKLHRRYYSLFTAAGLTQLTPEIQGDWKAVFRVPWDPDA